jgi:V/A-type H+-transporting ATPase subunit I
MITPMQKVTLFCMEQDTEETLRKLQELGVLHLTPITPPEGQYVEAARQRVREAEQALAVLRATPVARTCTEVCDDHDAALAVSTVSDLTLMRQHALERKTAAQAEIRSLEPYGDFNPALVKALAARGVTVRLFHHTDKRPVRIPNGATRVTLSGEPSNCYVAVISKGELDCDGNEFPLPRRAMSQARERIAELDKRLAKIDAMFSTLGERSKGVEVHLATLTDKAEYVAARAGMGHAPNVAYLQGYCAKDVAGRVESASARHGWGVVIETPAKGDEVPSLIRHPFWVKPVKAIMDIIKIVPGYREQDISGLFLIFFSVFFAMLIGDAGYGVVFLALTLFARTKMKNAPAYPFVMLSLLSICTIVWGTLTGNYFGIPSRYAPLSDYQLTWLMEDSNIMMLCFLIGAIHMTIAHVWRFALLVPSRKCLEQVGWIAVLWSMFFIARMLVAQVPAPSYTYTLLAAGVLLIALFMYTSKSELKSEWINLAILPLSIVSALVDVISYIRLFAVGMASLEVAKSFNSMALDIGFTNVVTMFFSSLILVLGHVLNIILCGLAVLVHGVRLNTLEFSMHMGLEWAGIPFKPFKKTAQQP